MRILSQIGFACLLLLNACIATADTSLVQRREVQQFIKTMVEQYSFDRKQLVSILTEAQFQPQIIQSMDKPYEKKNWDVYRDLFLTPERLAAGIAFWQANQATLQQAQHQFHVPAHIIVAIIGVETLYGKHQGNYRVLDALTTLAFNYPKRADFFKKELAEFLLLCREQKASPTDYLGSYAGAIGKPQFMPSSYRYYAIDFTGKGKKDLINDDKDAIGSVANYFHHHGWNNKESVAEPAIVSGDHYKALQTNTKTANYNYNALVHAGIKPATPILSHPKKAGIIELMTNGGPEFWVAYPNFYVITHYNTSPQYALVVYLFSEQLRKQWLAQSADNRRVG